MTDIDSSGAPMAESSAPDEQPLRSPPSSAPLVVAPGRQRLTLRTLFQPPAAPGTEPPPLEAHPGDPVAVERWFAFLDISGFTAYCDQRGEHAAIELLTRFRSLSRAVVGRRGARVAKWLGDGVMLVGIEPAALVATVAEVVARSDALGLDVHAGVAGGPVLLFEGDDYVGRPVNRAARLCDVAGPGEVLVTDTPRLPDWIDTRPSPPLELPGLGELSQVLSVRANDEVWRQLRTEDGTELDDRRQAS